MTGRLLSRLVRVAKAGPTPQEFLSGARRDWRTEVSKLCWEIGRESYSLGFRVYGFFLVSVTGPLWCQPLTKGHCQSRMETSLYCELLQQCCSSEEFQILQGQDWTARYYPTAKGEGVEGPGNLHGRNFRITALPSDCMQLEISWDLLGRQVTWKFLNAAEKEIGAKLKEKTAAAKKGAKARSAPRASNRGPFFLVGSWDNWKGRGRLENAQLMDPILMKPLCTSAN